MATHLIVDGYNVIGAKFGGRLPSTWDLEASRRSLLENLNHLKKKKALKITVVFDRDAQGSYEESFWGIRVVYAGGRGKADEAIEELVSRAPEGSIVATSDWSVAQRCRQLGAAIISASELLMRMSSGQGSLGGEEEEEVSIRKGTEKRGPAKRPSKRKRRERKRLGKLL